MFTIEAIEIILGVIGLASGIYDPWVSDEKIPVFVTFARIAGVMTFLLGDFIAMLVLVHSGDLNDPTALATIFFAVGSASPIIGRGAWSLIDVGTMFVDTLVMSYKATEKCDAETNGRLPAGNVGSLKLGGIIKKFYLAWCTLMKHSATYGHFSQEYMIHPLCNNLDKLIHGQATFLSMGNDKCRYDLRGWGARFKALMNILVFVPMVLLIFALQWITCFTEMVALGVGSIWIAAALCAHADELCLKKASEVNRDRPLECVVKELTFGDEKVTSSGGALSVLRLSLYILRLSQLKAVCTRLQIPEHAARN